MDWRLLLLIVLLVSVAGVILALAVSRGTWRRRALVAEAEVQALRQQVGRLAAEARAREMSGQDLAKALEEALERWQS